MKRPAFIRLHRFEFAGALLLALLAVGFVLLPRLSGNPGARAEVRRWTETMEWWDRDGTAVENLQRQATGLRAMGEAAVDPLIGELNYDPVYLRLLGRFQFLRTSSGAQDPIEGPAGRRRRGAHFLGVLGPTAARAVGPLIDHATDSDLILRFEVAVALGKIGRDEPAVRMALTNLLAVSDRYVPFGAALALWRLDPGNPETRRRVESMMPARDPAAVGECLVDQGSQASGFAPALARLVETMPLSDSRVRAGNALWKLTGERKYVLRDLDALGPALETAMAGNRGTGWSVPEYALITAAHILDDVEEFRDRLIPLLRMVKTNPAARAKDSASLYIKRLETLNRRAATKAPP